MHVVSECVLRFVDTTGLSACKGILERLHVRASTKHFGDSLHASACSASEVRSVQDLV